MTNGKTLAGLAAAGVFLAGFGGTVLPASADQRVLRVTLQGGEVVTVTVDVPPGTPLDQVQLPGVTGTVVTIEDITPPPPETQATTPQGTTATTPTTTT